MDKSWINIKDRISDEFRRGLDNFLDFAYTNKPPDSKIKCPCTQCRNSRTRSRDDVAYDVLAKGFIPSYTNWVHQGEEPHYLKKYLLSASEESNRNDDMEGLIQDALLTSYPLVEAHENTGSMGTECENCEGEIEQPDNQFDENTEKFYKLLKHAEAELFPGCRNFTFLSFIVRLLHVKSLCRWSNNSFTMLLEVLKEAFQHLEMFPNSYREAWKLIKDLGLEYKKIHSCPNDCMLYWKETENDEKCKHCQTSRYKQFELQDESSSKREQKIPSKREYFASDNSDDSSDDDDLFEKMVPVNENEDD